MGLKFTFHRYHNFVPPLALFPTVHDIVFVWFCTRYCCKYKYVSDFPIHSTRRAWTRLKIVNRRYLVSSRFVCELVERFVCLCMWCVWRSSVRLILLGYVNSEYKETQMRKGGHLMPDAGTSTNRPDNTFLVRPLRTTICNPCAVATMLWIRFSDGVLLPLSQAIHFPARPICTRHCNVNVLIFAGWTTTQRTNITNVWTAQIQLDFFHSLLKQ